MVQQIPLAAHEAEMGRMHKLLRIIVICWVASVVMLASVVYSLSMCEFETTTETVTTETTETTDTSENSASSGDGGVAFAG